MPDHTVPVVPPAHRRRRPLTTAATRRTVLAGFASLLAVPARADADLYFWQKKGDPVDPPKDWVVPVYKFTVSQTPVRGATNVPFRTDSVAIQGDYIDPLTVSLACGRLPAGVYLDKRSGVVFGNSNRPVSVTIALRVEDNRGNAATTRPFDVTISQSQE